MKRKYWIIILMCLTTTAMAKQRTTTIRVIGTTDIHGAFFPYDFIERTPMKGSVARMSTYIKKQRQEYGENLILLDNGDILQGQPTCYYCNYINPDSTNVAADVINYLKYDAETIGNHDIETGHPVYDKWAKEVKCPVLGANVVNTLTGQPYFTPYITIQRDEIKIAVLGLLTPAIPNWLHKSLWSNMAFENMVTSAQKWIDIIKEKEKPDVIVGLFHSGWNGGIATMHYDEDATKKVAELVAGFDVIFFGHDHMEHISETDRGVLCLNPSCNAQKVAQVTVEIQDGKIVKKTGELIDITHMPIDTDFMARFQQQIDVVKNYVERKIGTCAEPLSTRDCFFGSAAFTDYIHALQLKITGADISLNAPLTFDSEIKVGNVYMSDMFKLYRYENQIYALNMTGKEVRQLLEMSYDQWVNTMHNTDDHIMLLDETMHRFKNLTFNFDSAAGIDYEVDVTKPNGQKVHIIGFTNGKPFRENEWYKVAMNSYRGNGGGELLMRGAGIPLDSIPQRIVFMSERDQRYYLTKQIEQEGVIKAKANHNWRFVPAAWADEAIKRDKKLLFEK